jgi:hypothetical protein
VSVDPSRNVIDDRRRYCDEERIQMSESVQDRRRLLRSTAGWLLGGVALTATRSAKAWEVKSLSPTSPLGIAVANRCGGPTDHAWLVAQLKTELAEDPSAQTLSAICPLCGCPVVVSR